VPEMCVGGILIKMYMMMRSARQVSVEV
jgi:hypothetical protein